MASCAHLREAYPSCHTCRIAHTRTHTHTRTRTHTSFFNESIKAACWVKASRGVSPGLSPLCPRAAICAFLLTHLRVFSPSSSVPLFFSYLPSLFLFFSHLAHSSCSRKGGMRLLSEGNRDGECEFKSFGRGTCEMAMVMELMIHPIPNKPLIGENSPYLPQDSGAAYKYIY